MKTDDKLFNYMLSIIFIAFIVFILGSLIFVSRYVLSDKNVIGGHVTSTKNLLDDVNNVEIPTENTISCIDIERRNIERFKFNSFEDSITDFSILNVNEDKGIISFVFDSQVKQFNNIYYLIIKEDIRLEEGFDVVYILEDEDLSYGRIFSKEDDRTYKIFSSELKEVIIVEKENILGKVIFKDESQS